MIYLDSAATTLQKPPAVARAVSSAVGRLATPGRGGHVPAMRAAETAFLCRQAAAELFQVESPEQVVFTSNATHGLNLAIHSLLKPGDAVVISGYEHNAVTRPLHALGVNMSVVGCHYDQILFAAAHSGDIVTFAFLLRHFSFFKPFAQLVYLLFKLSQKFLRLSAEAPLLVHKVVRLPPIAVYVLSPRLPTKPGDSVTYLLKRVGKRL